MVADGTHRLGIHIRTSGGLPEAALHASDIGSTTFQIMSGNPSAWNPGVLDMRQAAGYRAVVSEKALGPVFLHAGYLINLSCRSGRNAPIYAKSIKLLQENIDRAAVLGCEYVVVHMGSRRGTTAGEALKTLVDGIAKLNPAGNDKQLGMGGSRGSSGSQRGGGSNGRAGSQDSPMLLLENGAGSGDTVGASFEELGDVLKASRVRGVKMPLGICLDTAHMWGAGYDISSRKNIDLMVDNFSRLVGLEHLHLVHFNDSPVERGSKRDKHEHIGCGIIPLPGLRAFARHHRLRQVPLIMETPGASEPSDIQRMTDLKKLAGEE